MKVGLPIESINESMNDQSNFAGTQLPCYQRELYDNKKI